MVAVNGLLFADCSTNGGFGDITGPGAAVLIALILVGGFIAWLVLR